MTFLWPPLLLAVLAVPIVAVAARRLDRRRRDGIRALAGPGDRGPGGGPSAAITARPQLAGRLLGPVPGALVIVAFVCFAIALARPQATLSLPHVEGTLILTFDVSGSMAADDVDPSRMEVAKAAAKAIVDRQPPGVVIGVVAFSDAGLTVQPPTAEAGTVLQTISRLGPTHGTSVGEGILAALDAIQQAETDTPAGYYSNRSAAPSETPAPVAPGSHDAAAVVLFSDGALDEGTLKQVAALTSGRYEPATHLDAAGVYDQLSRHLVTRDEALELTAPVAGIGLLLLVAGVALSLVRTGRLP